MKSYGKNHQRREVENVIRELAREEVLKQAEHYDLCMLMTLHKEFGFGAERLKRYYHSFSEVYRAFKARYFDKDDVKIFGERGDTYEMREYLKKIGFDYEKEVKELTEES